MEICTVLIFPIIAKEHYYRNRLNRESGSFGEYILVKYCVQMKIPNKLSFEQAATLGAGTVTCVR